MAHGQPLVSVKEAKEGLCPNCRLVFWASSSELKDREPARSSVGSVRCTGKLATIDARRHVPVVSNCSRSDEVCQV